MKNPDLRPIKAIIFDMDGTIFDTESFYERAWSHATQAMGVVIPEFVRTQFVGLHFDDCKALLLKYFDESVVKQLCHLADCHFIKHVSSQPIPLKAGIHELLDAIDAWGLPMSVATNSETQDAIDKLASRDLLKRFKTVVGCSCVYSPKPKPDVYLKAASFMSIEPEDCVAVEDSAVGLAAAHAACMRTVLIPDRLAPTDTMRAQADVILSSCHELLDWLNKRLDKAR